MLSVCDNEDKDFRPTLVTASDIQDDLDDTTEAVLGYIAGYLSRAVTKDNRCDSCADLLIDRRSPPLEVRLADNLDQAPLLSSTFIGLLDRGKLIRPTSTAVDIASRICWIWRTLVQEENTRRRLFGSNLPRAVFVNVVSEVNHEIATSAESIAVSDISCEGGHCLSTVVSRMAGSLFNLFASNLVRDANSRIHGKWKKSFAGPGASASGERCSRDEHKRRKLCGSKKT